MIKRTLFFSNPAYLSMKNAQLEVCLSDTEKAVVSDANNLAIAASIPIEDIGVIVLEHQQITITHGLMAALIENNVSMVCCNAKHLPTGLLLSLSSNTLQNERYRSQLNASEPLKKQLWAQTVMCKIKNQTAVLSKQGIEHKLLLTLYKNVKSGDSDNCEATAAAYYWKYLSPLLQDNTFNESSDFKRYREGNAPNNYLNYGYAILRAVMARSIVAAGLLPTLGIHHANRYNAYCLADDLMEPYRPFVDQLVIEIIKKHGLIEDIPKEIKALLLKIPVIDVMIENEKSPLMVATQRTAVSLVKCFEGEQRKLVYPEL